MVIIVIIMVIIIIIIIIRLVRKGPNEWGTSESLCRDDCTKMRRVSSESVKEKWTHVDMVGNPMEIQNFSVKIIDQVETHSKETY